jgi:hypothetical protein
LSKALAAALATGAVATVNSTIWNLATSLSTPRLILQSQLWGLTSAFVVAAASACLTEPSPP